MKKAIPALKLIFIMILFLMPGPGLAPCFPDTFAAAAAVSPATLSSSPFPSSAELARRINGILGKAGLRRVVFSACIVRCETDEIVYEKNSNMALLPASNMKIVTSAAALEHLGPDFAFVTRVGLCGDALVVIGSGDPLLGDRETDARNGRRSQQILQEIAARLKETGVVSVSDILLDASIFDNQRVHPSWPQNQLQQKYACEVSGLNYSGNCVEISAVNRKGIVLLSLDPPTDYVRLRNALTPGPSRKSWFSVDRTGVPGELLVQGNCRTQAGPYSVGVENPTLFFGRLLQETLLKAGISVGGEVLEKPVPEGCEFHLLAEWVTSMADCLQRTNKDSLGLAAEAFFKRLGAQSNPDGKRGSWEGGRKVLSEYLRRLGVADDEFVISDGSGLSRDNRLSANALTRVLIHLSSLPDWDFFKSSLAVGGLDGTIENHFWEKKYQGRVLAKSGYIQAVRSLSGVVHTDGGDYIFSFLANRAGNGARTAIDSAVKAVVDWAAKPAARR